MRRIFLILLLILLYFVGFSQNRVATLLDVAKYGTFIQVGDLIIDTPTKKFADGINQLRYTTVSKSFPGLRENGTIWVDGEKIGPLCEFRFLNGTETTPWHVSTVLFKPIPNTYVQGIYNSNSYGGFLYLIQGVKILGMDGTSEKYPGLAGLENGDFLIDRFGFRGTSLGYYSGYHVYSISVLSGGSFTFKGLEGEHGFSVMRFQGGSYDNTVTLNGADSYFHDSSSELMYIGATHGPPYSKIKVNLSNLILSRSGSEALQLQHMIDGSWIRSISIYSASTSYTNEFQPFQDTGIQISPDGGNVVIENITLDSWGSHGINIFGSPYTSEVKKTIIRNIAMPNGRGEGVYPHNSLVNGMTFDIDNLFIWNQNGDYYINNKTKQPNWTIGTNNGTDVINVSNINYSGTATLFQNLSKINVSGTAKIGELTALEYVNSGFHEPANKIVTYNKYYGKYFSGADSIRVKYRKGDIIIDREPGFKQVFVKALNDFTASNTRPKNNKVNCQVLTWDSKTVRSDQLGWCSTCAQRPYPPDDVRVKYNNYYGQLGIGYVEAKPDFEALLSKVSELEKIITDLNNVIAEKDSVINNLSNQSLQYKQDLDKAKQELSTLVKDIIARMEAYK